METDMRPTPIGRFTDTPSYEELQREVARLRLTDAEREAIELAADVIAECEDDDGEPLDGVALTLRGILDRLK